MVIDEPLSDAIKATVKKQVEFYFSDGNVARDKFLAEKIDAHPEGYVEIALLCSFSRMTKHLRIPAGQSPEEVPNAIVAKVANALEGSETLQLSDDRQWVKRKVPLPSREQIIQETDNRTIYAKPLPFDTQLDTLTDFWGEAGKVESVRMRRHMDSKDFKGSVFVEFDSAETADKVVKREDIEYAGAILRLEKKVDYMERKRQERKENAAFKNEETCLQHAQAPSPTAGSQGEAKPMDATSTPGSQSPAPAAASPPAPSIAFELGTVLRFKFKEGQNLSEVYFKEIRDSLGGREGGVTYVEYNKGSDSGLVRFKEASAAEKMLANKADGLKILNLDASLEKIGEDLEKEFHQKASQAIQSAEKRKVPGGGSFHVDNKRKSSSLSQRGRGRGGRFGKRGRMS